MKLHYILGAAIITTCLAACEKDEFQDGLNTANLAQMFDSNGDISRAAYKKANTDGTLKTLFEENDLTGFLPSESAFKNAGYFSKEAIEDGDEDVLQNIFLYHVIEGARKRSEFTTGVVSALNDVELATAVSTDVVVTGEGNQTLAAKLIGTDARVSNGYVHTIDRLLLPQSRTVVDVVDQVGVFNLLAAAVEHAELTSVLEGTGPFTIFAPTDAAFLAFLNIPSKDESGASRTRAVMEADAKAAILDMDKDELADLLKYHVVNGTFTGKQLTEGNIVTLNDASITIDKDDSGNLKTVAGSGNSKAASPLQVDVLVTNAYIHAVDQVLIISK